MLRLGKRPARPGAIKLKLRDYINLSVLPAPPAEFGHDGLVKSPWGMLGNDAAGDCVWAGGAHETMVWNAEAGIVVSFDDTCVLSDYSAVTGYVVGDDSTDQGTDMQTAAAYRKATGLLAADGTRHKVGAYLEIEAGNLEEHLTAAYLFGAVGIGITFPDSAMDQFNAGQPWSVVTGSTIEGGHYVPFLARRAGMFVVVTWAAEQQMQDSFFAANNDESVVYLSSERLKGGKSLDGFDLDQLNADLAALK
jgi:hypothetical protein